jgi:hypothetical protein
LKKARTIINQSQNITKLLNSSYNYIARERGNINQVWGNCQGESHWFYPTRKNNRVIVIPIHRKILLMTLRKKAANTISEYPIGS